MMDADRKGMDYLFPSSRAAVEYGNAKGVKATQSDIVFNSPIVLYTHKAVADGLVNANTTWPTSDTRQATGSSASTRPIR